MVDSSLKEQIKSFLAGGLGGICLVLVGHPFDLIKVRAQTALGRSSLLAIIKEIITTNGLRGMYRGVSAPLIGVTPIFAVCFWGYDVGLQLYRNFLSTSGNGTTIGENGGKTDYVRYLFAGGFSALPTTLIMTPSERLKVVMQTSSQHSQLTSAFARVWKEGGLRSLFRGSMATLARDVPGSMAYFGTYEVFKRNYLGGSTLGILAAGGFAGIANWIVAIPADVVKSRLQASTNASHSALSILKELMKNEGFTALFRGIGPVMLRAFPANAACFFGMETGKSFLKNF